MAGVLALIAGGMVFGAEQRRVVAEVRAADMREELEDRRIEIVRMRERDHRSPPPARDDPGDPGRDGRPPAGGRFLRPQVREHRRRRVGRASQTDTKLLADPETNLFSEAYFRVALDARIASARRHLRPVAIALVEVNEGVGTGDFRPADPVKVTGSIRSTLRDADTACRMIDGCFALILEDTPENGAVWTVERIRRNLISRHGHHTLWAGVACYPAHAFSTDELLDQANLALESAREWKQDRIEVATAD